MKLLQTSLKPGTGWNPPQVSPEPFDADLVLAFGQRVPLSHPDAFAGLKARFPSARIILASTAGSFADTVIEDDAIVCTALKFERSRATYAVEQLASPADLEECCHRLGGFGCGT